jgi:dihydrofolate synthase/folylpolyglutamate synthase
MDRSTVILERLLGLHPREIDLSLDRVQRLMTDLGNPEQKLAPVIHLAGTNGKGSTTAFLRAMLEAAGKKVHVYTSPHLVSFRERIRLGGKLIEEGHQVGDWAHKVKANGAEQVGCAAIGRKLGDIAPDTTCDVAVGTVGDSRGKEVNAVDAPVGEEITLSIGVGVPVT